MHIFSQKDFYFFNKMQTADLFWSLPLFWGLEVNKKSVHHFLKMQLLVLQIEKMVNNQQFSKLHDGWKKKKNTEWSSMILVCNSLIVVFVFFFCTFVWGLSVMVSVASYQGIWAKCWTIWITVRPTLPLWFVRVITNCLHWLKDTHMEICATHIYRYTEFGLSPLCPSRKRYETNDHQDRALLWWGTNDQIHESALKMGRKRESEGEREGKNEGGRARERERGERERARERDCSLFGAHRESKTLWNFGCNEFSLSRRGRWPVSWQWSVMVTGKRPRIHNRLNPGKSQFFSLIKVRSLDSFYGHLMNFVKKTNPSNDLWNKREFCIEFQID